METSSLPATSKAKARTMTFLGSAPAGILLFPTPRLSFHFLRDSARNYKGWVTIIGIHCCQFLKSLLLAHFVA
jgi:hypothetical protein